MTIVTDTATTDDIAQLRAEFEQAEADLAALIESLPPHVQEHPEPHEGGYGRQFEPHRGWTDDELDRVHQMRARLRGLALALDNARRQARTAASESAD